ncbi:protein GOLM2-like isoform X1 [Periplaneta americana]|uniref:protein GOLM2-like isoform X1 n=1 Tax=Periplaneta americana TaxID=6978 RepID=UPI0037E96DD1
MSLDSMRGSYGRCPPFLVAGLLVVCIILTFNWWSLSSQNYDLIKQLEELGEQLKISSEEQDLCVHQRLSVEGRVKTLEEEMAQLRVRLEQQRAENDDMKKVLETRDDELKEFKKEHDKEHKSATLCNTELDSLKKLQVSMEGTIQTLKLEKSQFTSQLDEQKQEIQQLRQDLEQARAALDAAASKAVKQPVFSVPNKLSTAPSPKPVDNGVSEGGDHEKNGAQELDKAENEENNAGERGDDPNAEEGAGDNGADDPVVHLEDNRMQ